MRSGKWTTWPAKVLVTLDYTSKVPLVEELIFILQTLRQRKHLGHARYVHAILCDVGLETCKDVGNYLVPVFVDCRSILEAQQVFSKIITRNQYSWTSLVQWHISHCEVQQALKLYQQMKEDCISPSSCTFLSLLKGCAQCLWVREGLMINSDIIFNAYENNSSVGSALVDMYAKCGLLAEAQRVFVRLPLRDVVLWTALIAGYAETGDCSKALSCFEQMQKEGMPPNAVTFVASLKACWSCGVISRLREMHIFITKLGFEKDCYVSSALVDIYANFGMLVEAQKVFDLVLVPDLVLWNVMIAGYVRHQLAHEGLRCYQRVMQTGLSPDATTYSCTLKACGIVGALHLGQKLHTEIIKEEFDEDLCVGNSIVGMYVKCDSFSEALEVFNELSDRDVVSWNTVIVGYTKQDSGEAALSCFDQMQQDNVSPNKITFLCTLEACGSLGALERGQALHSQFVKEGCQEESVSTHMLVDLDVSNRCSLVSRLCLGTVLIDVYGKCGAMDDARGVFDGLPKRGLVVWNTLMTGYTHQGSDEAVLYLFERMIKTSIEPDNVTFLCIFTVCSFAGLVDFSRFQIEVMKRMGVVPTVKHLSCMVDSLGRAGRLDEALFMIENIPFEPDLVIWSTILGACQQRGNVELGRQAHDCALTLNGTHFAAYISMSNIYATAQLREDIVERVLVTKGRDDGCA